MTKISLLVSFLLFVVIGMLQVTGHPGLGLKLTNFTYFYTLIVVFAKLLNYEKE